jgi:uncharacterized protein
VKVDVGAVLEAGREVELHTAVSLPDFGAFRFPTPAQTDLELRRVGRTLAIDGTIEARYGGDCERCLETVDRILRLDVDEKLTVPTEWEPGDPRPHDEGNVLAGTMLDVDDLVRQLVDAALPIINLCTDECAGLCARCGHTNGACECGPTPGGTHGEP